MVWDLLNVTYNLRKLEKKMNLSEVRPENITSKDIDELVGTEESQRLEFKQKLEPGDRSNKELLRDIVAMVNSGGGYIIIGAKEKGGTCVELCSIEDAEALCQRINNIVIDGIDERITGISIFPNKSSNSETVVLIHLPDSVLKPHMVKKDNRTEFLMRYNTDKREMTAREIKEMVRGDELEKKLLKIENQMSIVSEKLSSQEDFKKQNKWTESEELIFRITDIDIFRNTSRDIIKQMIDGEATFRIAVTPKPLTGQEYKIYENEIVSLLKNPPNQRYGGWNLEGLDTISSRGFGVVGGEEKYKVIYLYKNGHLDFYTTIESGWFTWQQEEKEAEKNPWLWPYAVCEYPISFLRLAKNLWDRLGIVGGICEMNYFNIKGCILRPGHPNSFAFRRHSNTWQREDDFIALEDFSKLEKIDVIGFNLIKQFYFSFGYTETKCVPFFDDDKNFIIRD